jgi:hypothetical protein
LTICHLPATARYTVYWSIWFACHIAALAMEEGDARDSVQEVANFIFVSKVTASACPR